MALKRQSALGSASSRLADNPRHTHTDDNLMGCFGWPDFCSAEIHLVVTLSSPLPKCSLGNKHWPRNFQNAWQWWCHRLHNISFEIMQSKRRLHSTSSDIRRHSTTKIIQAHTAHLLKFEMYTVYVWRDQLDHGILTQTYQERGTHLGGPRLVGRNLVKNRFFQSVLMSTMGH